MAYQSHTREDEMDVYDDLDFNMDDDGDDEEDEPLDIPALHDETSSMLAIKTKALGVFVPLPIIQVIYFDENCALVPTVPADLQLAFFFATYNDIAGDKFVALKSALQHIDINRAIWYYGIDMGHSFSRYFEQLRYNIIVIAFVWAGGFDEKCCAKGCKSFVEAYIMAWIESLVYQHDITDNTFSAREDFLRI
jgi:hypothetical protein